jgi:hypothetical protein
MARQDCRAVPEGNQTGVILTPLEGYCGCEIGRLYRMANSSSSGCFLMNKFSLTVMAVVPDVPVA